MKGLDLSKFKKISSNEHTTKMQHPEGHIIEISHKALSPQMRRQLEKIPHVKMSDGGEASTNASDSPKVDPQKAKEVEAGATKSGWQPTEWKKNLKEGLGLAEGGQVGADAIKKENYDGEKHKKLEIEKIEPKHPVDAEPIKPKHPVEYEKLADGGEVADDNEEEAKQQQPEPSPEPSESPAPEAQAPVTINVSGGGASSPTPQPSPAPNVAVSQQQPATKTQQALQGQQPQGLKSPSEQQLDAMNAGFGNQVMGATAEAKALGDLGQQQAQVLQDRQLDAARIQSDYAKHVKTIEDQNAQLVDDINKGHIDPHRLWSNMNTGSKVLTTLGVLLGGIGAGLSHTENYAMQFLNKQIDDDINAQKSELGKKQSLLDANYKRLGNLKDAMAQTRLNLMDSTANQLQQLAAKSQSPQASAAALKFIGQLQDARAPLVAQQSMKAAIAQNPDLVAKNPSQAIQFVVPQQQQGAAYKELQEASHLANARQNILNAFQQVSKLNTPGQHITSPLQTSSQINALVDPLVAGLSKATAGRFTEQDAKYLSTLFPKATDSDKTRELKFQAINNLVSEKMKPDAFPVLTGYGIPLSGILGPQQPASAGPAPRQLSAKEQQYLDWAKKNPNDPRSQAVIKKLGQ